MEFKKKNWLVESFVDTILSTFQPQKNTTVPLKNATIKEVFEIVKLPPKEVEIEVKKSPQPSIKNIKDFYKTCGLVGEETNCVLITLAALRLLCFGVESPAGSGKTVLTDILMLLLPESYVYTQGLGSDTSAMYDNKAINNSKIIYIEELQKVLAQNKNLIMLEFLKNLTEGKDLNRRVTAMTFENGKASFRTNKQHIKGDKGIIYTLALENKQKKDAELGRRVLVFNTDITEEQNKRVIKYIGKTRFNKKRLKILTNQNVKDLKEHCKEVLDLEIEDFQNPFAEYIAQQIPSSFTIVRTFVKHYFNLMDANAKFHYKKRLIKDKSLFLNIQDCQTIHSLYGSEFNACIHHLPQMGKQIMQCFEEIEESVGWKKDKEKGQQSLFKQTGDEERKYLSISDIHKILKGRHILLKHKIIQNQVDLLVEAGFLGLEQYGKKTLYYKTDEISEFEDNIDWEECLKQGQELFKKEFPNLYEEWNQKNTLTLSDTSDKKQTPPKIEPVTHSNESLISEEKVGSVTSTPKKKALALLDLGTEMCHEELVKQTSISDDDINYLISKGEIFEPRKGFYKILK